MAAAGVDFGEFLGAGGFITAIIHFPGSKAYILEIILSCRFPLRNRGYHLVCLMPDLREKAHRYFLANKFTSWFEEYPSDDHLASETDKLWYGLISCNFHILLANYEEAEKGLEKLDTNNDIKEAEPVVKGYYHYLHSNLAFYRGNYTRARKKAKKAKKEYGTSSDNSPWDFMDIQLNEVSLAKCLWRQRRFAKAIELLVKVTANVIEKGEGDVNYNFLLAKTYHLIGVVLMDAGYNLTAVNYFKLSKELYQKPETGISEKHIYHAVLDIDLANCLLRILNEPRSLREYFTTNKKENKGGTTSEALNKQFVQDTLVLVRDYLKNARDVLEELNSIEKHRYGAHLLRVEARLLTQQQDSITLAEANSADELLQSSIAIREKIAENNNSNGYVPGSSRMYNYLARLWRKLDWDKALEYALSAAKSAQPALVALH